jgi:hypothetical protein
MFTALVNLIIVVAALWAGRNGGAYSQYLRFISPSVLMLSEAEAMIEGLEKKQYLLVFVISMISVL